jgi:Ala-tRNA(Pro) deacylase
MGDAFTNLIAFLDEHRSKYRVIAHAPEGRTEVVSQMRGHPLDQAAKCIVMMVKIGKKTTKYVLGVVPGDALVNLNVIKSLMNATYISFASPHVAERLAGSEPGTILPFSFNSELELIADPSLLEKAELYFNAARLDRSIALNTNDYVALANPRLKRIAMLHTTEPGRN